MVSFCLLRKIIVTDISGFPNSFIIMKEEQYFLSKKNDDKVLNLVYISLPLSECGVNRFGKITNFSFVCLIIPIKL